MTDENGEFFVKLKSLVEETYAMNENEPVTLLVHSMGGSMALHFLRLQAQAWKDRYVRRLISLSTPWGGAVKALKVFAIGILIVVLVRAVLSCCYYRVSCGEPNAKIPNYAFSNTRSISY